MLEKWQWHDQFDGVRIKKTRRNNNKKKQTEQTHKICGSFKRDKITVKINTNE